MELEDWIRKELNNGIIESFEQTLKLPVCEHNIVYPYVTKWPKFILRCTNCGRMFTDETELHGLEYDYDIDNQVWRRTSRTNPDTCEHRVIQSLSVIVEGMDFLGLCVNCDSTLSPEWISENHWEHGAYNVWVWTGPCNCEERIVEGFNKLVDEIDGSDSGEIVISSSGVERPQARTDSGN